MKKLVFKIIAIVVLSNIIVFANSSSYNNDTKSLIGVEGSFSSFDVENDSAAALNDNVKYGSLGLKIGAQTDSYRLFLSARYNVIDGYDYAYSLGIEAQYLLNVLPNANIFLGISSGYFDLSLKDSENDTRNFDSPYIGADLGFNIHLNEKFDFEFGGRILSLSDSKSIIDKNNVTYIFDNIAALYVSIIYKYDMD